jgi:hypothetical protein
MKRLLAFCCCLAFLGTKLASGNSILLDGEEFNMFSVFLGSYLPTFVLFST